MPDTLNQPPGGDGCQFIFLSFAPVGLEDYVSFFRRRFPDFAYLRWRFPHSGKSARSEYLRTRFGTAKEQRTLSALPPVKSRALYFALLPFHYLFYLAQGLAVLWARPRDKTRVLMGVNYFCAFTGIVLRALGRVDKVIYRVMDFFPLPPSGPYRLLNRVFYLIDSFCLKRADAVIFTTEGHIQGREKYGYFHRGQRPYTLLPLGVDAGAFAQRELSARGRRSLVYCGVISRYHMLDLAFEALARVRQTHPDVVFNVIGTGPDEAHFRQLAKDMGLEGNVAFHGFVEEGPRFADLMADNILGIALYRDEENFMKYTEPAKVKHYMGFGVPVAVSRVPRIAWEVEKRGLGFALDNDAGELADKINTLLADKNMQKKLRDAVAAYVPTIDVPVLLSKALEPTLAEMGVPCA